MLGGGSKGGGFIFLQLAQYGIHRHSKSLMADQSMEQPLETGSFIGAKARKDEPERDDERNKSLVLGAIELDQARQQLGETEAGSCAMEVMGSPVPP